MRVHAFVQTKMDNGENKKIMSGTYCCSGDDGELARIHGFLGTALIKSHIKMILAHMWDRPTTATLSQESSRLVTPAIIATERMRSFIFPQEIVQEMIRRDQWAHREITLNALHNSIKAVITLICGLNRSTIEEGTIEDVTVTGVCMVIINMNSSFPTAETDFPPENTESHSPYHKDLQTSHNNFH